jgi:hypothetical protein
MPDEPLPSVDDLQFKRAERVDAPEQPSAGQICAACKQPISADYFKVHTAVICSDCAAKIEAGRQAPKKVPLFRAVIYGAGAALAGCILYAIVLAMGVQIGIVALAVGWMVGKAIRKGAYGVGGRPQQILAVALTYFAISTSFLPAAFFVGMKKAASDVSAQKKQSQTGSTPAVTPLKPTITVGAAVTGLVVLITISPFLELFQSPVGGLISLFILFIGLQRAWALTARHDILVTGPYSWTQP